MKIGILVPHLFAQDEILNRVIFAPIHLAIDLADKLCEDSENEVYLFTPGKITTKAKNITTDLTYMNKELELQGCTLEEMITQTPLAFVSLARQINTQLTAEAFEFANQGKLDVLHVFMSEDETPLYYANLLKVPVVFTHHDPYNFYRKYRARFPILKNLNYISISMAQRKTAPAELNFVGNVYNGLDLNKYEFIEKPDEYYAFLGRIVQVKGCHDAISVCKQTDKKLYIAGKYYKEADDNGEDYWSKYIAPEIDNKQIYYRGYLKPITETSPFLGHAKTLLFPSKWDEPFGMVVIEALACGTPVIAYRYGAIAEIIENGKNGFIVDDIEEMKSVMEKDIDRIDRAYCRKSVEKKFSVDTMASGYREIYKSALSHINDIAAY